MPECTHLSVGTCEMKSSWQICVDSVALSHIVYIVMELVAYILPSIFMIDKHTSRQAVSISSCFFLRQLQNWWYWHLRSITVHCLLPGGPTYCCYRGFLDYQLIRYDIFRLSLWESVDLLAENTLFNSHIILENYPWHEKGIDIYMNLP